MFFAPPSVIAKRLAKSKSAMRVILEFLGPAAFWLRRLSRSIKAIVTEHPLHLISINPLDIRRVKDSQSPTLLRQMEIIPNLELAP